MELTYPQIMTLYDHLSMKGSCLVLVFKKFSFLYPWSQGYCCLPPSVPTLIYFVKVEVAQSCLTLCDPMDFSRNSPGQNTGVDSLSFLPRDWTQVSRIADEFFTSWATRKAQYILYKYLEICMDPYKICRVVLCAYVNLYKYSEL